MSNHLPTPKLARGAPAGDTVQMSPIDPIADINVARVAQLQQMLCNILAQPRHQIIDATPHQKAEAVKDANLIHHLRIQIRQLDPGACLYWGYRIDG